MSRMPDPRSSLAAWFASAVREHRMRTGMSQTELAKHTNATQSLISQYETGSQDPTEGFAKQCDKAFNTGRLFYLLWWHWKHEKDLDFWQRFVDREQQAVEIKIYQGLVIPGLFQIEDYARAVFGMDSRAEVDHLVTDRLGRQGILNRPEPPQIQALIDESVLSRPFGGPGVMRSQLEHLIKLAQCQRLMIQLIPTRSSDHPGVAGNFQILRAARGRCAYLENQHGGRLVEDDAELDGLALSWDEIRSRAEPVDSSQQRLLEMIKK